MRETTFNNLSTGDIIKHIRDSRRFIVTGNYGGRITAVATIDAINPSEWRLVKKIKYKEEK